MSVRRTCNPPKTRNRGRCTHLDRGVAVAEICSDTDDVGDIMQRQVGNKPVHLQEHRKGLTNATGSTEDCNFLALNDLSFARGPGPCAGPGHMDSDLLASEATGAASD